MCRVGVSHEEGVGQLMLLRLTKDDYEIIKTELAERIGSLNALKKGHSPRDLAEICLTLTLERYGIIVDDPYSYDREQ